MKIQRKTLLPEPALEHNEDIHVHEELDVRKEDAVGGSARVELPEEKEALSELRLLIRPHVHEDGEDSFDAEGRGPFPHREFGDEESEIFLCENGFFGVL